MNGLEITCILTLSTILLLVNLKLHRDLTAPAVLMSLIWLCVELFSFLSAPDYYFSFQALLWIQLVLLLFTSGASFAVQNKSDEHSSAPSLHWIVMLQLFTLLAAPLAILSMIRDSGLGFPTSGDDFLSLTQRLTSGRYAGEHLSMITMGLLTISYIGCLNGGLLVVKSDRLYHRIIALAILPLLLGFTVVYTARATFLFGLLFFMASFLLSLAGKGHINRLLLKPGNLRWIALAVISLVLIFMSTQLLRSGDCSLGADNLKAVSNHLRVWFSGNLSGYSFWFDFASGDSESSAGISIAGLMELIGGGVRKPGIYQVAYDASGKQEWTNIFTIFRYLMDDLGAFGTLIFMAVFGWISTRLYHRIVLGSFLAIGLLSGITALLMFSFVTSVMAYNTVLFAWMGYCFFLSLQQPERA